MILPSLLTWGALGMEGVEGVEEEEVIMVMVTTVGVVPLLFVVVVISESERRLLRCSGVSATEEAVVEDREREEDVAEDKEIALALRCCSARVLAEVEELISRGPSPRLRPRFISREGGCWLASLGAWCNMAFCCCCCCWNCSESG